MTNSFEIDLWSRVYATVVAMVLSEEGIDYPDAVEYMERQVSKLAGRLADNAVKDLRGRTNPHE